MPRADQIRLEHPAWVFTKTTCMDGRDNSFGVLQNFVIFMLTSASSRLGNLTRIWVTNSMLLRNRA